MGQVRHGSATTTHAIRAAIQRSQASTAVLSRELGINPKTVSKSRKRETVEDRKTGPKETRSTVLSEAEEATIVAFRRRTLQKRIGVALATAACAQVRFVPRLDPCPAYPCCDRAKWPV